MGSLYWMVYSKDLDPITVPIPRTFHFLTHLVGLDSVLQSLDIGVHPLITQWTRGLKQMKPAALPAIPSNRLEIVLQALKKAPFEPVKLTSLKFLTLKTVFLVAITSYWWGSELQALCLWETDTGFRTNRVTLAINPKVNSAFHTKQLIQFLAFHAEANGALRSLSMHKALKFYIQWTLPFRQSTTSPQLFLLSCHQATRSFTIWPWPFTSARRKFPQAGN
jgi:hypothetical protein